MKLPPTYPLFPPAKDENDAVVQYAQVSEKKSVVIRRVWKAGDKHSVYPFDREGNSKFEKIKVVSFEGLKGRFPQGFYTSASYGYGPTGTLFPLFRRIQEQVGVSEVCISRTRVSSISNEEIVISESDLKAIFSKFSGLNQNYREDSAQIAASTLHELLPKVFKQKERKYRRNSLAGFIESSGATAATLSSLDAKSAFNIVKGQKGLLDPEQILSTRQQLDEIYIEDVVDDFEQIFKRKNKGKDEEQWQKFFQNHSWVLSQLFGMPVVLMSAKAYVGGKSIDNKDGKIADFLYKNSLTSNVAIVEIKDHTSELVAKQAYRGSDVFAQSPDLSGGVSQVLDQRDSLQKEYFQLAKNGTKDFDAYGTICIVISGTVSKLNAKQLKSFEIARANSKDVQIYAYDEVREKLLGLKKIIKGEIKPKSKPRVAKKTVATKTVLRRTQKRN